MKIKITRNTIADGKPVYVDQVVDVTDNNARNLISLGKATAVGDNVEITQTAPILPAGGQDDGSLEGALEGDPDLGTGTDKGGHDDVPDLASLTYANLVEMATDHGVANAQGMKKIKLIDEIKAAQARKVA